MEGDGKTFTIDPRSGELSLLRTVDREAEELFRCDPEKTGKLYEEDYSLVFDQADGEGRRRSAPERHQRPYHGPLPPL